MAKSVDDIQLNIDGIDVKVSPGSTILDACDSLHIDTPTLCFAKNLTPVNACRVCVVELEGSRTLVPACARSVVNGMKVRTTTERVLHSRRLVLELLASSVDLSHASKEVTEWQNSYKVKPNRFGIPEHERDIKDKTSRRSDHHIVSDGDKIATVNQPAKVQDELYVRDYKRCILCYKCVEACGTDAQNTFAISVAGRGFDSHISTEYDQPLPESACVYCGNCIGVCPTGALVFKTEFDHRERGTWDESNQKVTRTVCSYCGVGCNLDLHVQDQEIVKVTSPEDHSITNGHLCIKGRFGFQYVEKKPSIKR